MFEPSRSDSPLRMGARRRGWKIPAERREAVVATSWEITGDVKGRAAGVDRGGASAVAGQVGGPGRNGARRPGRRYARKEADFGVSGLPTGR